MKFNLFKKRRDLSNLKSFHTTYIQTQRQKKLGYVLGGTFGVILVLSLIKFFTVKTIKAGVLSCASQAEIVQAANLKGAHILFLNKAQITDRLKQKFLCLDSVKLNRQFPSTIELEFTERTPALSFHLLTGPEDLSKGVLFAKPLDASPGAREIEATSEAKPIQILDFKVDQASIAAWLIVDKTGFVFKEDSGENLPALAGFIPRIGKGKIIDSQLVTGYLNLFRELQDLQISISSAKVVDQRVLLLLVQIPENVDLYKNPIITKLFLNLSDNFYKELASLQLILTKARIDLKSIESIDLRFDKPVVQYTSKPRG